MRRVAQLGELDAQGRLRARALYQAGGAFLRIGTGNCGPVARADGIGIDIETAADFAGRVDDVRVKSYAATQAELAEKVRPARLTSYA